ncbi:MAG: ABC transporter substrate-binding protein [Clostridia bacterium]|nr:ABC transporter substrate-binding protein [Clostridia bacterium]
MKKFFAMMLALAMLLTCVSAFADDDVVTLKIAHIGPTTGGAALYGQATRDGAAIAADEINALGGKYRVELINEDDEHNVEKAVNAYNAALDAGAQIILGTTTSKPCEAVGALAVNDRVFMLSPSASSEAAVEPDNVFQVCFTDPNQGAASAEYIAEHKLGTKVAIIYNNADVYSTGIRDTFVEKAAELGLEIVTQPITFTDETTDFTVLVAEAQNAGAEIVFLPIYYTPASQILTVAAAKEFKPIFFGVDGMDGILEIEGFDKSLAEGVMLLTPFVATAQDEKTVSFVTKYQEAYGIKPIQFAADAYDGIYIIVAAAEKAGITAEMVRKAEEEKDPSEICEALIAAMTEIEVEGLTGTMTWDESGKVTKTPMAATIVNGEYVFE